MSSSNNKEKSSTRKMEAFNLPAPFCDSSIERAFINLASVLAEVAKSVSNDDNAAAEGLQICKEDKLQSEPKEGVVDT